MKTRPGYLLDASVLIDYAESDLSVLALVAGHVGAICIPRPLLEEVEQVSLSDCERMSIRVIEPSLEQLMAAAATRGGPLSFQDRLCIIIAGSARMACVSNDKALRVECVSRGVRVLWGLELMIPLVASRHLTRAQALRIANAIGAANPRFITPKVLARFAARIKRRQR